MEISKENIIATIKKEAKRYPFVVIKATPWGGIYGTAIPNIQSGGFFAVVRREFVNGGQIYCPWTKRSFRGLEDLAEELIQKQWSYEGVDEFDG